MKMQITRQLIEYATKAPSGHNTQPWLFRIDGDAIDIYPNTKLALPVVDRSNRELYISLGCALENLCIASQWLGYSAKPIMMKTGNEHYIHVILDNDTPIDNPLFQYIGKRQSNRSTYNGKFVDADTINILSDAVENESIKCYILPKASSEFKFLRCLIAKGNQLQMSDKAFKTELTQWIRYNDKHSKTHRDGLSNRVIGSPSLPLFLAKPIVKCFLTPTIQNGSDLKKIGSSSHIILLTIAQNIPAMWVALGRELERLLLTCAQRNVAVAFMNQPCEIAMLSAKIQQEFGFQNEMPTIMLRIGYAAQMPYSLRRNVDEVIL